MEDGHVKFQSPSDREVFLTILITIPTSSLPASFNPLLIGEVFLTRPQNRR